MMVFEEEEHNPASSSHLPYMYVMVVDSKEIK